MDNNVQNDNKARLFEFIFGREKIRNGHYLCIMQ